MKISPSVLAADFGNLKKEIKSIEKHVEYFHLDIMDGNFVPNISFGIDVSKCIATFVKKPLDVHLMVKEPLNFVQEYIDIGAKIITVHYETINQSKFNKIFNLVKKEKSDIKLGMAISPETPYEVLLPYLNKIDLVLIMSVNPGYYGQSFIEETEFKVNKVSKLIKEEKLDIIVEVDGGINNKTIKKVKKADIVVAGKYIFGSEDKVTAIEKLK